MTDPAEDVLAYSSKIVGDSSSLGSRPSDEESPTILDQYANTSSAGSVIAFKKYNDDFKPGDLGVLSSFGAGYSIGSIVLKRI